MSSAVYIDSVLIRFKKGSLSVDNRIEERSTAEFVVVDVDGTESYARGTPVTVEDSTGTLIFGGVIDSPDKVSMSPAGGLYHPVICTDNHYYTDKRLVIASFLATDAGDIVTSLHTDFMDAEGITIGEIQTGPEIAEAVFNYVSVSECMDALAELAGFIWYIDENKALYFIDRITNTAPWTALPGTTILKNTGILSEGNSFYRNRQYVRGGTGVTVEQTETFTGDAVFINVTVGYPIATVPTVTVQDRAPEAQTVGIKGIDVGKDCYWNKGDGVITFTVAPENTKTVTVVYYGQYPLISLATNEPERIAREAIEGGTGIVENIVDEAFHTSAESSLESAQAKIADYARTAQKFSYQTQTTGLRPGQMQTVNYPLLGLNNEEMLVQSVTLRPFGQLIMYDVVLVVGPATGSWAKFFSSILKTSRDAIRIGDTSLVALLLQPESLALSEIPNQYEDLIAPGIVNRFMNSAPIDSGTIGNVEHEFLTLAETQSDNEVESRGYAWG